jgi:hypothetical protein
LTWLTYFDGALVQIVAQLAPWLAPLPTAWLVYDRTQQHLGWPWWVALIAGLTLEALGVAILATTLDLYSYNKSKRKTDPKAPFWMGLGLVVLYFLAAELLTVALDIAPSWVAPFAAAVFPALSVAAFAILAVRADHQHRLSQIEQGKADARAKRAQRKQDRAERNRQETAPEQEPSNPLPFECPICGDRFASQAALNGHGNKHKREEPPALSIIQKEAVYQ